MQGSTRPSSRETRCVYPRMIIVLWGEIALPMALHRGQRKLSIGPRNSHIPWDEMCVPNASILYSIFTHYLEVGILSFYRAKRHHSCLCMHGMQIPRTNLILDKKGQINELIWWLNTFKVNPKKAQLPELIRRSNPIDREFNDWRYGRLWSYPPLYQSPSSVRERKIPSSVTATRSNHR